MTRGNQVFDDGRADESGGAGDKYAHEQSLLSFVADKLLLLGYCSKVVILSYYNG